MNHHILRRIYGFYSLFCIALCVDKPTNDQAPVSISSLEGFLDQRRCARDCFGGGTIDRLASRLGCVVYPPKNECYCRGDLQPVARTYLSDCAKGLCTFGDVEIEIATALSFYNAYCKANAPVSSNPSLPSSVPAKTTDAAQTFVPEATPRNTPLNSSSRSGFSAGLSSSQSSTMTHQPTTIASSSGKTGSSGLSQADKIALGTGLSVPILGIVVTIFICRTQRNWFRLDNRVAL